MVLGCLEAANGLVTYIDADWQRAEGIMAEALAQQIIRFPQQCLLSDRRSAYEQFDFSFNEAMKNEFLLGLKTIESGETLDGAARFTRGAGRHGSFGIKAPS